MTKQLSIFKRRWLQAFLLVGLILSVSFQSLSSVSANNNSVTIDYAPWLERLIAIHGIKTTEELLAFDTESIQLSETQPIIQAMFTKFHENLAQDIDSEDIYNDTFILQRLIPDLSEQELDTLNTLREHIFYDSMNKTTDPVMSNMSEIIGIESPTVKEEWLFYLQQSLNIQKDPVLNEIINRYATHFSHAPEAHLFEFNQDGYDISVSSIVDIRTASGVPFFDFRLTDATFYETIPMETEKIPVTPDSIISIGEKYGITDLPSYTSDFKFSKDYQLTYEPQPLERVEDNANEAETSIEDDLQELHPNAETTFPEDWTQYSRRITDSNKDLWVNMVYGEPSRNLVLEPIFYEEKIVSGVTLPGANVYINYAIPYKDGSEESFNLKADKHGYFEMTLKEIDPIAKLNIQISDSSGDLLGMYTDIPFYYQSHLD